MPFTPRGPLPALAYTLMLAVSPCLLAQSADIGIVGTNRIIAESAPGRAAGGSIFAQGPFATETSPAEGSAMVRVVA
jgi:hypothetical protein